MKKFFESRKAIAFMIGVTTTVGVQYLGLSEETATKLAEGIVKMVMMYLGLQGTVDIAERVAAKVKPKKPNR